MNQYDDIPKPKSMMFWCTVLSLLFFAAACRLIYTGHSLLTPSHLFDLIVGILLALVSASLIFGAYIAWLEWLDSKTSL